LIRGVMKKILLVIGKGPDQTSGELSAAQSSSEKDVSVILIQDGVRHQKVSASRVFVLSEDAAARQVISPFPSISYPDMLRMMFEFDTVMVL